VVGENNSTNEVSWISFVRSNRMLDRPLPHHRSKVPLRRLRVVVVLFYFALVRQHADGDNHATIIVGERRSFGVKEYKRLLLDARLRKRVEQELLVVVILDPVRPGEKRRM